MKYLFEIIAKIVSLNQLSETNNLGLESIELERRKDPNSKLSYDTKLDSEKVMGMAVFFARHLMIACKEVLVATW